MSVRLEVVAWRAGEFVGTKGTGQVREGPGKFRRKLRSKISIDVNCTKQALRGGYRIRRAESRPKPLVNYQS